MKRIFCLLSLCLSCLPFRPGVAAGTDCRLRFAYPNIEAAPLYLGNSDRPQEPPGMVVELARAAAEAAGCRLEEIRLPTRRTLIALRAGEVDMVGTALRPGIEAGLSLPPQKNGKPGMARGLPMRILVYVLKSRAPAPGTDPERFLEGKRRGLLMGGYGDQTLGGPAIAAEQVATLEQNLAKLHNGRIDAFIANPALMTGALAQSRNADVVALDRPYREFHANFVFSRRFARDHPTIVSRIWDWIDEHGVAEMQRLKQTRYTD